MMFRQNSPAPATATGLDFFEQITSDLYDRMDLYGAAVADRWKQRISVDVEYVTGPRGGVGVIRSLPGEPPRRETRTLYESIESRVEVDLLAVTLDVDTDVFYAPMLEEGTERMAARPHLMPAFDESVEEFFDLAVAVVAGH